VRTRRALPETRLAGSRATRVLDRADAGAPAFRWPVRFDSIALASGFAGQEQFAIVR